MASITETKEAITASGGVVSGPVVELPGVGKILNFEDPEAVAPQLPVNQTTTVE